MKAVLLARRTADRITLEPVQRPDVDLHRRRYAVEPGRNFLACGSEPGGKSVSELVIEQAERKMVEISGFLTKFYT